MLRLEIASLRSGIRTDSFEPEPGTLGLDDSLFSNIRVIAHLDKEGDRVHVRLEVAADARLQCDRTLVDYDQPVAGACSLLFVPAAAMAELGGEADDLRELLPGDTTLDVTEAVRDTILLSIPLRRIAPGADDVDIPTTFGEPDDEDVDPRWEALRGLRSDQGSED